MKPRKPAPRGEVHAYRLLLEYDGSGYAGWQRQENARTVAGSLERVLHQAGLRLRTLHGSGRTDAGVHALGQVAHLHLLDDPKPAELLRILNGSLPSDIVIRGLRACAPSFHARHDALRRTYKYQLSLRRSAFAKPFLWWVKGGLDLGILASAWKAFEGTHDVSSFADLEPGEDPRCGITSCEWVQSGSLILLRATADHFLRRQVRRMVGAAVRCALGDEDLGQLRRDLAQPHPSARTRWAEQAAPAAGLFLEHIQYPGEGGPGPLVALVDVP